MPSARGKAELTGIEAFLVKTIYGFVEWWTLGFNAQAYGRRKRADDKE